MSLLKIEPEVELTTEIEDSQTLAPVIIEQFFFWKTDVLRSSLILSNSRLIYQTMQTSD